MWFHYKSSKPSCQRWSQTIYLTNSALKMIFFFSISPLWIQSYDTKGITHAGRNTAGKCYILNLAVNMQTFLGLYLQNKKIKLPKDCLSVPSASVKTLFCVSNVWGKSLYIHTNSKMESVPHYKSTLGTIPRLNCEDTIYVEHVIADGLLHSHIPTFGLNNTSEFLVLKT